MNFHCIDGDCEYPCESCIAAGANINFEDVPKGLTEAEKKQFQHDFYKKAEKFREEIKIETLKKAALKYQEPFNPSSWTIEELAKHAMAENYDQQNYIYGMYQRLIEQEKKIKFYENRFSLISNYLDGMMKMKEAK